MYTVRLFDRDNSRNCSGSYTVTNSNWNRYTVSFPADTTGKFDDDHNSSLELFFHLVNGSDTTTGTLQTTWASSADAGSATGQVNLADSTSNEWEITGIQLEVMIAVVQILNMNIYRLQKLNARYYNVYGRAMVPTKVRPLTKMVTELWRQLRIPSVGGPQMRIRNF